MVYSWLLKVVQGDGKLLDYYYASNERDALDKWREWCDIFDSYEVSIRRISIGQG